ncbi:MAG: formyltetrahydrofolate deformylase, partial [Acidobacteria bacterium]|nr:formyltetrahydrofolate deformylase [Acidobacteriota bacterium]
MHRITGVLFDQGLNIISNGEFVDQSTGHFFMRTVFAAAQDVELSADALRAQLAAVVPVDAGIHLR